MRLDLADLRLFLCVVDAGSITQGAVRANLALASASERLRSIEADAGVPLLERRHRGVATTEAGEALAHHARIILRQQALLRGELQDFAAGERGTLHLYANTAALTEFLPRQLAPWLAARPRLRIELKERTSAEIVRTIAAGLAQAGIVSDAVEPHGLRLQPVAKDHLALIVPAGHRLAAAGTVDFAAVLDEPFVGLAPGNALQDHIDEHARAAGGALAPRIRMKTFEGLCEMVSHGVGVGIVPRGIASRHRRRYPYQVVALADDWARRQLCLCFRAWEELSAPMQGLLAHLGADPRAPQRPARRRDAAA
ncbi:MULTISPECIES: LysR substrate-binding domain-containing protein [Bordetella]|uniref:LysR family transcriptional regulator n=2 Tax=Bordetella TaxID=517 RepID=A0A261W899_9BORD|nr:MULTISPECIES: LysR substrate-binding domain-containing protein [Bordetella]MDM9558332.1 LysR substrate-binding domain-containing protein [Bordetella petrii]OZI82594.1 LysR family transcriptional regulator [Bordetella genomosp. 2]